ncbi:hypothetical protein PUR28_35545 [Streptomyces sp. BE308]|uniref:hypothetical protein n=1 Tax=unclassified Streptomyces TaxID=2593676 RepID=UPI002DD810A8|nr:MULTISPECIES: hypothetical protein [unclassified Streptomyces]MEE1796036.1 hypothetical protein [Streptomyces sp. BE308]WRZ75958.1 hypothetical protein OG251_32455 [Streptomyces sp. NBC_01237]
MVLTPRRSIPSGPALPAAPSVDEASQADQANEAIRALVDAGAGQDWSSVESAKYEVLLIEWAAATRTAGPDIIEAA